MAEISLMTEDKIVVKEKYISVMPKFGVIDAISSIRIKAKWIEIFCDLMSPKKRDDFRNVPHWDIMTAAWEQTLWNAWTANSNGALGDVDKFWDDYIVPLDILKDFDNAPESNKPLYETWLWSGQNRKDWFVVYNDDATEDQIRVMGATVNRMYDGKIYTCQGAMFDYENDSNISAATVGKINDKEQTVHPKFSQPVAVAKFTEPDLSKYKP